ncbi:hypothetical protein Q0590_08405 [Rhodocytophaga aerolata]|uniref:Uncharacterized protein n=1 Tax=Rhodocytophaga aerolata TaxID=455078 RepID=A0ABT8R2E0_9BACT|nr:hypothetical protein [Rhodocytophaga aerolata]MDO1446270.1 hypothetical protein [Rhodocytophaga aerolata]
MYTFQLPPQQTNQARFVRPAQAKLDHYKEQTDEMLETTHELLLAYDLVKDYSKQDASYYLEMYHWMNARYDYVMSYAMSFIPVSHATY